MTKGSADVRHRKVVRAAGMELNRIASAMKARRGIVPDGGDDHVDAVVAAMRAMAAMCDASRGETGAQVKRRALGISAASAGDRAAWHAANALLVTINNLAIAAGLDPYEGLRP